MGLEMSEKKSLMRETALRYAKAGKKQKRRRSYPKKYGDDVKKLLTGIWLCFGMMCGQRLVD